MTAVAAPQPTVLAILKKSTAFLASKGVADARLDAERLLAHGLKIERIGLYLQFDRPLLETELATCRELVQRRGRREPLQHILGDQPFRRVDIRVTADTLVPRPETEEVVDHLLTAFDAVAGRRTDTVSVLDVGTGSGCIAISVAEERPAAQVVAVDVSEAALTVAEANARANGVVERVRFVSGDLFAPVAGQRFDLIVSNPPYLTEAEWRDAQPEVRDHEPRTALVGGADGLALYRRLFSAAADHLAADGAVVVEIGCDQGPSVAALAERAGFDGVTVHPDLGGRDRCVVAWARG